MCLVYLYHKERATPETERRTTMKSYATKDYTVETESIFSKTDAEYEAIDKALVESRKLFAALKELETLGKYGTALWMETFAKYADAYKKANGYRPHWAR